MPENFKYAELTELRLDFTALQATADELYARIGAGGRRLADIFATADIREKIGDISGNSAGLYISHGPTPADDNMIYFHRNTLESAEKLLSVQIHERTHALQFGRSAALQMEPATPDNDIVVCPRDYVWAMEAAERDASAKQGMFLAEIAALEPKRMRRLEEATPMLARFLDTKYEARGDVHTALARAGDQRMAATPGFNSLRHYYNQQTLASFAADMMPRRHEKVTYVRLEAEDIVAIGSTYGINSLGGNGGLFPRFQKATHLSLLNHGRLGLLNHLLRVGNERDLPTVSEALAARGMDRQAFLMQVKNRMTGPG